MTRRAGMVPVLFVSLGVAACHKPVRVDYSGPIAEWPEYGGDKAGLRYSPLTQITRDAKTGTPCTDFGQGGRVNLRDGMGDVPIWEYYVTSPPFVIHDLVVVGGLVADNQRTDAPPGVVRAFDARTGALRWWWDPVPGGTRSRMRPASDGARYRRATANVWAIISGDPARDLVFLPMGNAAPDYFGGERQGLDYFSSSLVALRASSGKVVWRFQTVHHDLWDYDLAAQPTLYDEHTSSGVVPAVIEAAKTGHVFILNRETGIPLFPVEERSVPGGASPGDTVMPTQPFPTLPPPLIQPT